MFIWEVVFSKTLEDPQRFNEGEESQLFEFEPDFVVEGDDADDVAAMLFNPNAGIKLNNHEVYDSGLIYTLAENGWDASNYYFMYSPSKNYIVGERIIPEESDLAAVPDTLIFKRGMPITVAHALKTAIISDAEASQLLAKLAPYIGVSGAISFEILKYLLGSERTKLEEWLENQSKVNKYDLYQTQWL